MQRRLVLLLIAAAVLVNGCDRGNEEQAGTSSPGDDVSISTIRAISVTPEFAGAAHNAYLDMMYELNPQASKSTLVAASAAVLETILADYNIPASVIVEILEDGSARFDDLVDRELMSFPVLTSYDPAGIADHLVATGVFAESDRADLAEFITDLFSVTGSNKTGGCSSVVSKWREADCSQGIRIATEITASSSNYWTQKHEPLEDQDIIAIDGIGALLGLFGGAPGSIILGSYASYVGAIYMDDVGDH